MITLLKASMVSIFIFCSDVNGEWDDNDAKVVCRMLGHATEGAKATNGSKFGTVLPGRDTCPWTSSSVMDPRLPSQTATTTEVWRAWGVS